jgi:hypothetical protein
MALISKAEIVSIAFPRAISQTKISDSIIAAAQFKYIKPLLGNDLYAAVVANPTDAKFTAILPMIKNALAWWVKHMALPEIFVEISDTGVHQINANNAQTVADQRFIEVRAQVADNAAIHCQILSDYLKDNSISGYIAPGTAYQDVLFAGGIIFEQEVEDDTDREEYVSTGSTPQPVNQTKDLISGVNYIYHSFGVVGNVSVWDSQGNLITHFLQITTQLTAPFTVIITTDDPYPNATIRIS